VFFPTPLTFHHLPLEGPKLEIFVAGIFTQIRPVWMGDLETRAKNSKNLWLGPYFYLFIGEIYFQQRRNKKLFWIA
jgi:hypothetical protein